MEVTVDKVGRVVIPKRLRTAFGIGPDSKLTMVEDGSGIRIEPVPSGERMIEEHDGFLVLGTHPPTAPGFGWSRSDRDLLGAHASAGPDTSERRVGSAGDRAQLSSVLPIPARVPA